MSKSIVQIKSKFNNRLPSNILSYYMYLYFMRLNSVTLMRTRFLFLFNSFYFSNSIKKILYRLRRVKILTKSRHAFAFRYHNYKYSLKYRRRRIGIRCTNYKFAVKHRKHKVCRPYRRLFIPSFQNGSFRDRRKYNQYPVHNKHTISKVRIVRKANLISKGFIRRLLTKRFFKKKRNKFFCVPKDIYKQYFLAFSSGPQKISRAKAYSLLRYLNSRLAFFGSLCYIYRLGIFMFRFVKFLVRRYSIAINLKQHRRYLYKMEYSLMCANVVQNIFVNSEMGKRGLSRETRDHWYGLASFMPYKYAKTMFTYNSRVMALQIGFIKISERFAKFMNYLMNYLTAVRSFFELLFKSLRRSRKYLLALTNVNLYTNHKLVAYFFSLRTNVLRFFPRVFKGCDYIFNSVLKQFRLNSLKKGRYNVKVFARQVEVVTFIKDILYLINKEFMCALRINNYKGSDSRLLRLRHKLRVNRGRFWYRSSKLSKNYITYYMYKFFGALFMFTCAYHFSTDKQYLYTSGDMLKYNYLLSSGSMVFNVHRSPSLVRNYGSSFLHNNILDYSLVVKTSRSNCTAVLLVNNKVIYSSSCGKIGFLKTTRSTYFAANQLGLFLCLFLSSIYGLYLRFDKSKFKYLNPRYLLRSYLNRNFVRRYSKSKFNSNRKFIRRYNKSRFSSNGKFSKKHNRFKFNSNRKFSKKHNKFKFNSNRKFISKHNRFKFNSNRKFSKKYNRFKFNSNRNFVRKYSKSKFSFNQKFIKRYNKFKFNSNRKLIKRYNKSKFNSNRKFIRRCKKSRNKLYNIHSPKHKSLKIVSRGKSMLFHRKCKNKGIFADSALKYNRLSIRRLRHFTIQQRKSMKIWCNNYLYKLIAHRIKKCYRYNTSIASVRLNLHITGTGISRLAVRRPIFRFVNMIRRSFTGNYMIRHDNDTSDINFTEINQLDSSSSTNNNSSSEDDDSLDSDGCANSDSSSDEAVNLNNNVVDDSVQDDVPYSTKASKFRYIDQFDNDHHFLDRKKRSLMGSQAIHEDLIKKLKNMFKFSLYGVPQRTTGIAKVQRIFKMKLIMNNCLYSVCSKYLLLYRHLRRRHICVLLHTFNSGIIKRRSLVYTRLLVLLIFGIYSNLSCYFISTCSIVHTVKHSICAANTIMYNTKYLYTLITLNLFFKNIHKCNFYKLHKLYMVPSYLYLYMVHSFIANISSISYVQCTKFILSSTISLLYILLKKSIAIDLFLYDILEVFFHTFFMQILRLFNIVAWYKNVIRNKFSKELFNTLADFRNSFCSAGNRARSKFNLSDRAQDNLVIIYNYKTISVPHNGCRARKIRRK